MATDCGLIDAKIRASDKDLPFLYSRITGARKAHILCGILIIYEYMNALRFEIHI